MSNLMKFIVLFSLVAFAAALFNPFQKRDRAICKREHGFGSFPVRNFKNDPCTVYCRARDGILFKTFEHPADDGSFCGRGKVCQDGACVEKQGEQEGGDEGEEEEVPEETEE